MSPRIIIYYVMLIIAEQNRNRAYETWGLHCSFQSVNLHHGATALRPQERRSETAPLYRFITMDNILLMLSRIV